MNEWSCKRECVGGEVNECAGCEMKQMLLLDRNAELCMCVCVCVVGLLSAQLQSVYLEKQE